LGPAVSSNDPSNRQWALLSLVTGRREESREFTVSRAGGAPRAIKLPVLRRFERPGGPLTSSRTPEGFGLVRLNNSLGDMETIAAFDAALTSLRDTRALILDLRDTPSGGQQRGRARHSRPLCREPRSLPAASHSTLWPAGRRA
jgi:carboxyl-terminal processing protease